MGGLSSLKQKKKIVYFRVGGVPDKESILTSFPSSENILFANGCEDFFNNCLHLSNLVIIDSDEPYENLLALLNKLKANLLVQKLPIVVLSPVENMSLIQKFYEMGVSSYIVKSNPVLDKENLQCIYQYWTRVAELPAFIS